MLPDFGGMENESSVKFSGSVVKSSLRASATFNTFKSGGSAVIPHISELDRNDCKPAGSCDTVP
jgi:hypothetical protein